MKCMGRDAGASATSFTSICVSKVRRQRSGHAFAKGLGGGEPNVVVFLDWIGQVGPV